jgi:hypothetical protein
MNSVSWKASKSCKTVGELLKSLEGLPEDTPLRGQDSKKNAVVRYEHQKDKPDDKWVTVGGAGW